jgi:hypothetical protein
MARLHGHFTGLLSCDLSTASFDPSLGERRHFIEYLVFLPDAKIGEMPSLVNLAFLSPKSPKNRSGKVAVSLIRLIKPIRR